jgi:hypothetical protein
VTFLYGDSTESGLEHNYIEFLRATLDLAIEVLLMEHRVQLLHQQADDRKRAADGELGDLRQFSDSVGRVLDAAPGAAQSAAMRCAAAIRVDANEALRVAAASVRDGLADQLALIGQEVASERVGAGRAMERFLLAHDIAGGRRQLELSLMGGSDRYSATLSGRAEVGIEWLLGLEIPPGSPFLQPLRLDRLGPGLELKVPESGGWMRKGTRIKTQRLGGHYVVELCDAPEETTFKLRATPHDDEAGLDIQVGHDAVRLVRVAKGGERWPPFEPVAEDLPRLLELVAQLREELAEIATHRRAVLDARIDGNPIGAGDGPSIAVRRLITALTPVMLDIARHSLSADELVLKRVLADGRREEIFVAKSDLVARLEQVPATMRNLFIPLGLGATAITPSPQRPAVSGSVGVTGAATSVSTPRTTSPPPMDRTTIDRAAADHTEVDPTGTGERGTNPAVTTVQGDVTSSAAKPGRLLQRKPLARSPEPKRGRAGPTAPPASGIRAGRPSGAPAPLPAATVLPSPPPARHPLAPDDDDVTMVVPVPTPPPREPPAEAADPTGETASPTEKTGPPAPERPDDSVSVALSELEREQDSV